MPVGKLAASKGSLHVPKTRSGRRSISVATLLKRDKEGTLYKRDKTATVEYRDGDRADVTGIPAVLRRKKYEGPTRELEDPYPNPKTENRQEIQETKSLGSMHAAEGYLDTGKYANRQVLGDARRKWEGPSRDEVGSTSEMNDVQKLRSSTGVEAVHLENLSPEIKVAQLQQVIRSAFLKELSKTASIQFPEQYLDDLIKEALFRELAGGLSRGLVGGVNPQGVPVKGLLSPFQGTGARMQQAGTNMMTSPAQRIQAAGASPTEAGQLAQQAQRFGVKAPGIAGRVGGEAIQTAGKHVSHASHLGLALDPIGTVLGGGVEGAVRGLGKEVVRSTANAGGVMAGMGRAMQTHAGKAGLLGDVVGSAALGGMVHGPVSMAGMAGSRMAGMIPNTLKHLQPAAEHLGSQLVSRVAPKALKFMPRLGV